MIEYRIQHYRESLFTAQTAKAFKALVVPQPAIYMIIIDRIVSVRARLKNRPDEERITAQGSNPVQLLRKFFKKIPGRTRKIIPLRAIPHTQCIDMIKNFIRK